LIRDPSEEMIERLHEGSFYSVTYLSVKGRRVRFKTSRCGMRATYLFSTQYASCSNRRALKEHDNRTRLEKSRESRMRGEADSAASKLEGAAITLTAGGSGTKLYGSITAQGRGRGHLQGHRVTVEQAPRGPGGSHQEPRTTLSRYASIPTSRPRQRGGGYRGGAGARRNQPVPEPAPAPDQSEPIVAGRARSGPSSAYDS